METSGKKKKKRKIREEQQKKIIGIVCERMEVECEYVYIR